MVDMPELLCWAQRAVSSRRVVARPGCFARWVAAGNKAYTLATAVVVEAFRCSTGQGSSSGYRPG